MYVNAHTQTDNLDFGKNSEGGEGTKNFEENKNMGKKTRLFMECFKN